MGGVLTIKNDRLHDFEILRANIFTPSQGICLQRLEPGKSSIFKFDNGLAYGSWYDIQIIGRPLDNNDNKECRYLKKGVYLTRKKIIKISKLTHEKHRDHGIEWSCGSCQHKNIGSVAICENCFTNKSQTIINVLSYIPLVGVPFSVTNAVLQCGKASQSNTTSDKVDAGLTTVFAAVDVVFAPFAIDALIKVPAKVTAETGIKLTTKTVFCEAGKPLVKEAGKVLGKDGISAVPKVTKEGIKTIVTKFQ